MIDEQYRQIKTYSELIQLPTFEERYNYLRLQGIVGAETFGSRRYMNQAFYGSRYWKDLRSYIISRDMGCDLGVIGQDYSEYDTIIIHHINPLTPHDIEYGSTMLTNPENLISCRYITHQSIHYGVEHVDQKPVERYPNDMCPWKR